MNPVALVTGASRGIGRGIALQLAELGYDLLINYAANAQAARQTAEDCVRRAEQKNQSIRAEICPADISQPADRSRLVDHAKATFGRIDLLVNNAGIAPAVRADLLEATEESYDRVMSVNLKGPYFLTQLVGRWMVERQRETPPTDARFQARIVFVTSISTYTASVQRGDYCLAKAGLAMATKLFAARLADHGINVYEIRPGIIATDMTGPVQAKYDRLIEEGLTPLRRWGKPDDVARAVAAIALDLLPFSTGAAIDVDGGFHLRRL